MTIFSINDPDVDDVPGKLRACLDEVPMGCDWSAVMSGNKGDSLAAVLVPLIWRESDWQILMTKRSAHLQHHAGQVSFPGGKLDPSDAGPVEAALREAKEEISLAPSMVEVMGGLSPVRSPVGFIVQPVVGIIVRDIFDNLLPDPAEVESIFTLPLAHIAQPCNFTLVPRKATERDNEYWVVSHPLYHIWGLSARVLNDLHQRLFSGRAS